MERLTAAELMQADIGPRQFAVHDLIPLGGVTVLSAKKGRGKSVFTFGMSHACSLGREFLGRPTRRGQVLYIGSEDDAIELRKRYALLVKSSGDEPSDNLDITNEWPPGAAGIEQATKWCQNADEPVMIVIDVVAHVVPELINVRGGWVRVLRYMTPWIDLAQRFNIAIIFVTHNYRGADFVDNPIERVQGSGGLTAYAWCVLVIQGRANETERQLDYAGKHGHGQLALTIDGSTMTCALRDAPPAETQASVSRVRDRILNLVRENPGLKAREYARRMPDRTVASTEKMLELMERDEMLVTLILNGSGRPGYFTPGAAATAIAGLTSNGHTLARQP